MSLHNDQLGGHGIKPAPRFSVRLATLWQPTQEALLQAGALKRSKEDGAQNDGSNGANTTAPKRKNLGEIEIPWWFNQLTGMKNP